MERKELHHRLGLLLADISFLERRIREQTCCKIPTCQMVKDMGEIVDEITELLRIQPLRNHYWWVRTHRVETMVRDMLEIRAVITKLQNNYPQEKYEPPQRKSCPPCEHCHPPARTCPTPVESLTRAVACLVEQVNAVQERLKKLGKQ